MIENYENLTLEQLKLYKASVEAYDTDRELYIMIGGGSYYW